MAPVAVSNATVAKPADGSFKHYDEAKIQPSNKDLSALSRRDGNASNRPSSRDPSQDGLRLVGPSCQSTPNKPTRPKSAPSSISMNSVRHRKKISMLALASGRPIFGRSLALEEGRSKQVRSFGSRSKHLPTMNENLSHTPSTTRQKSYENLFHTPSTTRKDLHHPNRITQLLTEALSSQFHRKTLCYSKSKTMLEVFEKLLIHKPNNLEPNARILENFSK